MKNIYFIDNDNGERSKDEMKNAIRWVCGANDIDRELFKDVELITDFHRLEKEKMFEILFNPNNIILSYSMFTATHFGSLYQLIDIFKIAGRNEVNGIIYFDCSGQIMEALSRHFRDNNKDTFAILNAIETNIIITYDTDADEMKYKRLRIELKGTYENPFRLETVDITGLICTEVINNNRKSKRV